MVACRVWVIVVIALLSFLGSGCEAAFAPLDSPNDPPPADGDMDQDDTDDPGPEDGDEPDGDEEETIYPFYFTQAVGRVGESVRTALQFTDPETVYDALHLDEEGYPAYWFNWADRYIRVERLDFNDAVPAFDRIDLVLTVGTKTGSHEVLLHLVHVTDKEYKITGTGHFLVLPNQSVDGDTNEDDEEPGWDDEDGDVDLLDGDEETPAFNGKDDNGDVDGVNEEVGQE